VDTESDIASSMRVSVLSRSLPMRQTSTGTTTTNTSFRDRENGGLSSSASSVQSVIRSPSNSYASAMSSSTVGAAGAMRSSNEGGMSPAMMIVKEAKAKAMKDRPDSKLTPSVLTSPSILEPEVLEEDRMEEEEEGGEEYDDESGNGDEQLTSAKYQINC
jgi:hypothetical protein